MRISQKLSLIAVVLAVVGVGSSSALAETITPPAPWWGITTGSRPTNLKPEPVTNEVQEVTTTLGEFEGKPGVILQLEMEEHKVVVGQFANEPLAKELLAEGITGIPAATAANIQAALESDAFYGPGGVVVSECPGDVGGCPSGIAPWFTFTGAIGGKAAPGGEVERLEAQGFIGIGSAHAEVLSEGKSDGQLIIEADNLGNAPAQAETNGVKTPVTIHDKLPPGVTAASAKAIEGEAKNAELARPECAVLAAGKEVTCTYAGTVPPYEQLEVLISVVVEPGAKTGEKSGEVNTATVAGGGAVGTRTATHDLEIDGAENFGIESYTVVPENAGGSIDTQAGSHPFQVTSVVTANSTTPNAEGQPRTVALAKDFVGELPTGLVGNPTPFAQCTDTQFAAKEQVGSGGHEAIVNQCPASSAIGVALVRFAEHSSGTASFPNTASTVPIFNMTPNPGEPARFAFKVQGFIPVFLNASVRTGSDYGITLSSHNIIQAAWLLGFKLTFWGVPGSMAHDAQRGWECMKGFGECPTSTASSPPPLTIMPTSCEAPWVTTLHGDSWGYEEHPSEQSEFKYELPKKIDGCNHLPFEPSITTTPDVLNSSTSTGLNVKIHVPQTAELNSEGLAESTLRSTTVTLPAGVAVNPSGANGLEACSGAPGALPGGALGSPGDQIGYTGFAELDRAGEPGVSTATFTPQLPGSFGTEGTGEATLEPGRNFCPNASKIGTVKIKTPLLPEPFEGAVYLADQNANPFGSLLAMYAVAEEKKSGTLVKLPFNVTVDPSTGQLTATSNSPEVPFEEAEFHFFGGEKAPLATPAQCRDNTPEHPGDYETTASFVPWSAEKNDEEKVTVHSSSSFNIEHGPSGGPCPGASLPFSPTLTGGALNLNAGAFSPFTLTMNRKDGEQNLQSVEAKLPPGLSGVLSNIELCPEPQANLGECSENSKIGETTISVGVGGQPFTVSGGKFYLTGPYNGTGSCNIMEPGCAPFGLTFEVPAKAGPFDLKRNSANPAGEDACDCVIVRGKIEINPITAALTITSNPPGTPDAIPTSIEGIPLEIQHVNAITTRGNFQFNPTNCSKMEVTGDIHSSAGGTDKIGVPFQVTNCKDLSFTPKFKVSTSAKTSKAFGASLTATVSEPAGSLGTQANLTKVKVELPKQLPSRLTTLQKACTSKQFELNPANCPSESKIGYAKVNTPLLPVPLEGPAIFVSHGGESFPSLTMVLQGDNVTIDLVGTTFISKSGVTSTTFKTVPDQPFSSFTLTLPTGNYSALTALGNVCKEKLSMPTEFIAQNGAEIHQTTPIGVTGCKKTLTRAQKLAAALRACKKDKNKGKRLACVRHARKEFGPSKKKK